MENFIVSARKYRPATFASVVGQRHITSTLKNAIERGQLAHAYLFCGPRGVGKTTCARIFAKAINCLNPQAGEACNECESCRSFNEGRSLNVHELDAASNNSVDDIRNLIDQVRIIPQQGSYSVFVIDEVHMLSAAAFNAFLKTLEEPPRHAIFILATTEKHKIIPTILSRCQIYDFNRIKVEDGVEYLRYIATKEGVEADDEALNLIAHKADGGMRDALSMFDKAVSFCGAKLNYKDVAATLNVLDYDTYFKATELLIAGHYVDALVLFDNVLSRGFSPQVFIAGLNAHFRDLLMAKGPAVGLVEFTGTLVERYKAQAAQCSEAFLFGAISLLTEADGKIRQSSNQRLLVELGLMKIAGLGQKKNGEVADDAIVVPTYATAYPLPDLEPAAQPARVEAARVEAARVEVARVEAARVEAARVEVQHTEPQQPATPKPQPAEPRGQETGPRGQAMEQGVQETGPRVQSAEPRQQTAEPRQQTAEPRVQTADPKPQPQRPTARATRSSISLSNLLGGDAKTATELAAEAAASKQEITIDPHCEEKISIAKERIVDHLMQERRRFVEPFQSMTVEGNVVRLTVASKDLYNEIMRDKSEWQRFLAAESGAQGLIEIEVIVNEAIRVARPITLEDRLRHLVGRNERLTEMIDRLALDAE